MSAQADRWHNARISARTEHAARIAAVDAAMKEDFPSGSPSTRAFLAEDFVIRWILFGEALQ